MICKQCNNNVPNDSEYCPFCGNTVEKVITETNSVSDVDKGYTYLELKEWKKAKELFDFAIVNNDNKARAYIGRLLAKLKLSDLVSLSSVNKKLTKFDDFKMAVKYADDNYKQQLKKYYSLVEEKINLKKAKSKKRAIISLISGVLIVVLLALTYFVFIPLGRFSYYQNLLSNGKVEKATESFSNSRFFEYEEKAKKLFYNNGVSLVENKDCKNAEFCFDTTKDFKDSKKYYTYCKAQNLLAKKDLESYNYFIECKDFLDSKDILETNEYFIMVNKLQGNWSHSELKPHLNNDKVSKILQSITILSETIKIRGINVSGQYTKGKLIISSNNQLAIDDGTHKEIRIETDSTIYIEGDLVKEIKWEKK